MTLFLIAMFIQGFKIGQKDPILFDFDGLLMLGHACTRGLFLILSSAFHICRRLPHICDLRTEKTRQEALLTTQRAL
jgi:hypothetical protein